MSRHTFGPQHDPEKSPRRCERSEAIQPFVCLDLDCFVAVVPRNDGGEAGAFISLWSMTEIQSEATLLRGVAREPALELDPGSLPSDLIRGSLLATKLRASRLCFTCDVALAAAARPKNDEDSAPSIP
jgi:hypothetical protein